MREGTGRLVVLVSLLPLLYPQPVVTAAAAWNTAIEQSRHQFDARIHAELAALDASAEALFLEADAERTRSDHRAAAELYAKVFEKVPSFVHALRRRAFEELALGNHPLAIRML